MLLRHWFSLDSRWDQSDLLMSGIDLYTARGRTHPSGTGTSSRFWTLHKPLFSSPSFSSSSSKTGSTTAILFFCFQCSCWRDVAQVNAWRHWLPLLCSTALRHHNCQMIQAGCSLCPNQGSSFEQGIRCSSRFATKLLWMNFYFHSMFLLWCWCLRIQVKSENLFLLKNGISSEILCCPPTMTSPCHDLVWTEDLSHQDHRQFKAIGMCTKCVAINMFK